MTTPSPHQENPFTPTFGETPTHVAGRTQLTSALERALTSSTRRPELTSVFYGARGTGKTTLLSVAARLAQESGWIPVRVAALPGMLNDIEITARRSAEHLLSHPPSARISHVGIGSMLDIELERNQNEVSNWRSRMATLLDELDTFHSGVVITVDEIDPTLDELTLLASIYQIFVSEGRRVALLMAGLPGAVSQLLSNKHVSFLRRAQLHRLGRIADYDVREALIRTILDAGRTITDEALDLAVEAIDGFAYLIQLVGYRAWDITPSASEITADDMRLGIQNARAEMEDHVIAATYRELSSGDIKFLEAMTHDRGDSTIANITARLGWSTSQVSQYRRRLIDAGAIGARRRGVVGFELPYLKSYVAEHAEE